MLFDTNLLKDVIVALSFAGGLIPSVSLANKQATSSLLDAVSNAAPATTDSPPLRLSPLLFYPTPPRVADVLAVVSRIDAKALKVPTKPPKTTAPARGFMNKEIEAGWTPAKPSARRLLRRAEWAGRISKLPASSWPNEADDGSPAGGAGLRDALGPSSLRKRPLSPVAIDAVWVALSGGSSYLSPEELDRQLERWRPEAGTVRLQEFERALLQGRLTIVGGYLTLFGIQALVLAVFVLGPLVDRLS